MTGVGVTYQVDEVAGRIVRTIRTPGTHAGGCSSGIAAGAGVLGGTVSRVDLATEAVQRFGDFDVEAVGAGSLWTPRV